MSAAASEEAKARKQGAAKLEAHSAPSAGMADAEDQKHDGEAVDEKAGLAACDGERQSAAKPYALIKVRPPQGHKSLQPALGLSTQPCKPSTPSSKYQPAQKQALLCTPAFGRGALKVTRHYSADIAAQPKLC